MIIVTGANGFIGSAFVWELNEKGIDDIVCVDSVSLTERPLTLKKRKFKTFLLRDELLQFLETPEAVREVTWIVHMGACSTTTELNVEFLRENNTLYTQKLWDWCTKHQKPFIYASSAATYGDGSLGFDDTTDPEALRPLNPYGDSKVWFDRWAIKQTSTPPAWFGLKFFNVFGPNEYHKAEMTSVVYKAVQQINEKGSLGLFRSLHPNYEDGKQMRDFVYVKDVTRWMWELMQGEKRSGIYNMGFGTARTWLDLAASVFTNMDRVMKIDWIDLPEVLRERYQYFTEAKMARFLSLNVSKPQWPLEKAVGDYVRNYLRKDDMYL